MGLCYTNERLLLRKKIPDDIFPVQSNPVQSSIQPVSSQSANPQTKKKRKR